MIYEDNFSTFLLFRYGHMTGDLDFSEVDGAMSIILGAGGVLIVIVQCNNKNKQYSNQVDDISRVPPFRCKKGCVYHHGGSAKK